MSFIETQFVAESEYLLLPQPKPGAEASELYRAGLAFSTGHGAPFDLIAAHQWMNLAAARGNAEARIARAELAEIMTSAEIGEAQRRARQWLKASAH